MTLVDFVTELSKKSYDLYKYKIDRKPIYYNKRRLYKYKVGDYIYNLRTEDSFKYLIKVEVDDEDWENFRNSSWEYYLSSLNLFELVLSHLNGFCKSNKFEEIILPEEFEDSEIPEKFKSSKSNKVLKVYWFADEIDVNEPTDDNTLKLAIFIN